MRNWEGGWGNEGYEGERVMRERVAREGATREGHVREWPERVMRDWGGTRDRGWELRGGREEMRGFREEGTRGRIHRDEDDLSPHDGEAPIVKVIEVVAQSPHSWEDAARRAVVEASRTIHDIKSIWIKDMKAIVTRDRIVEFRIVAKISFAIHPEQRHHRDRYA